MRWSKQKFFANANKPGKLLATMLKTANTYTTPIKLKTANNLITGNPTAVVGEFALRLGKLYSGDPSLSGRQTI